MNGTGKIVGYIRVSTADQNSERQLDDLSLDKTFTDKASGKDTNRPQLQNLIEYVRDGDTVVIHSMDRLARSLDDLRQIVQNLTMRGVQVRFLKEGLVFTGDDSALSNLLLSVMGAFAEFERALINERQKEGISIAKAKGTYTGRKPSLSAVQIIELKARADAGVKKAVLANDYGISRETVYKYLK
ncbi:recombinase family protein [Deinococcus radiomollis]|uniref:recombinase family protein n=1 Tax=Deinococcus radiomollis TaxID=468916 RepID=UPI003892B4AA